MSNENQVFHIAKEVILDAAGVASGGWVVFATEIDWGLKLTIGTLTVILLYYRVKKAIKDSKP